MVQGSVTHGSRPGRTSPRYGIPWHIAQYNIVQGSVTHDSQPVERVLGLVTYGKDPWTTWTMVRHNTVLVSVLVQVPVERVHGPVAHGQLPATILSRAR